jgi:hypothetical protein
VSLPKVIVVVPFAILMACATSGTAAPDDAALADGGSTADRDGGTPGDAGRHDASTSALICRPEQPLLPLELLSQPPAAFFHTDSDCTTLEPVTFLRNTGDAAVRIDDIQIAPSQLMIDADGLPLDLASGDSFAVKLGLRSDVEGSFDATLAVLGDDRCLNVDDVSGVAVREGLISTNTYAWDFGNVTAGTTSEPREISFLYQTGTAELTTSAADGLSISSSPGPEDTFQIVSPPDRMGVFEPCEKRSMTVTFTAPPTPGRSEGLLIYTILTETPEGVAEGLFTVYLYGNSVAP